MTQLQPYLTPSQVAAYLTESGVQISHDAVRRWCRKKLIPAFQLPGGTYLVRREDAEAILTQPARSAALSATA